MEWGDNGLIIEAAATNAFNFKEGSPRDECYKLRLELIKRHIQHKRVERADYAYLLYNILICLQRTVAHADDLYGDKVQNSLIRYMESVLGIRADKAEKPLTEEEKIEIYRERYRQEYGGN